MRKRIRSERDLYNWLFEQDQQAAPPAAPAAGGDGEIPTPWITPEQDQKLKAEGPNRAAKNGNPGNDINMLQGESADNLWKIAMELLKYGRSATNPKVQIDGYGFKGWQNGADGAKWLNSIGGPDVLKQRIAKIAGGAAGLVKRADMPVLKSQEKVEIKNPETGEAVASGPQDQVAADLIAKGAIDIKEPFAASKTVKEYLQHISFQNSTVSSYVLIEYCINNGYQLIKEDQFPVNLTAADKDDYLTKGLRDGNPTDDANAIPTNKGAAVAVSALEPSQSDVYLSKALGFAFGKKYEGDPVIIAGNKVLDGHHRWAGANLAEPNFTMKGIQIGDPSPEGVATALKALRSMGNAMGNAQQGEAPIKESYIVRRSPSQPSFDLARWQRLAGIKR